MLIVIIGVCVLTIVVSLLFKAIKTALFIALLAGAGWWVWSNVGSTSVPAPVKATVSAIQHNPTVKKLASEAAHTEQAFKQNARNVIVQKVDSLFGEEHKQPTTQKTAGEPVKASPDAKVQQLLSEQHAKVLSKPMPDNILQLYLQGYPGSQELFTVFKEELPNKTQANNAFIKFYESLDNTMRKPALNPQELAQLKVKIKAYVQNRCEGYC